MSFSHHRMAPALAGAIATLVGCAALTGSAMAQGEPSGPGQPAAAGELTVIAPKVIRSGAPAWAQGVKVEVVTRSQTVNFADLDLKTESGANELRKRIMYAALDACDQLEAQYPSTHYISVPATQNCPDQTASAALKVGEQIIAASRAR